MRTYELKLKLPVEFIPQKFENISTFREIPLDLNLIDQKFKDFLASLNLYIQYGRYFYCPPNFTYFYHRDVVEEQSNSIKDNVKLNFVRGGIGSEMIWYNLKPGKKTIFTKNALGQPISQYNKEDLIEIHRANVGWPSLIDGYTIHNLKNTIEPRQCWTITLNSLETNQRLTWDNAIEIFQDYLII